MSALHVKETTGKTKYFDATTALRRHPMKKQRASLKTSWGISARLRNLCNASTVSTTHTRLSGISSPIRSALIFSIASSKVGKSNTCFPHSSSGKYCAKACAMICSSKDIITSFPFSAPFGGFSKSTLIVKILSNKGRAFLSKSALRTLRCVSMSFGNSRRQRLFPPPSEPERNGRVAVLPPRTALRVERSKFSSRSFKKTSRFCLRHPPRALSKAGLLWKSQSFGESRRRMVWRFFLAVGVAVGDAEALVEGRDADDADGDGDGDGDGEGSPVAGVGGWLSGGVWVSRGVTAAFAAAAVCGWVGGVVYWEGGVFAYLGFFVFAHVDEVFGREICQYVCVCGGVCPFLLVV